MKKYPLQTLGIVATAISMISYMGVQNHPQKRTLNQEINIIKKTYYDVTHPPKFKKISIETLKRKVVKR